MINTNPPTLWGRFNAWMSTEVGRTVVLSLGYAAWCIFSAGVFVGIETAGGNHDFVFGPTVFWCFQSITTGGFGAPVPGQYPTTSGARAFYVFYNIIGMTADWVALGNSVVFVWFGREFAPRTTEPLTCGGWVRVCCVR